LFGQLIGIFGVISVGIIVLLLVIFASIEVFNFDAGNAIVGNEAGGAIGEFSGGDGFVGGAAFGGVSKGGAGVVGVDT
jgi:hypothetical protein